MISNLRGSGKYDKIFVVRKSQPEAERLLQGGQRNEFNIAVLRDSLAKQMACKASIKANHYVSSDGVKTLIADLNKCENPFNCPHGRPVFVKITNYEIEKMFKRVV